MPIHTNLTANQIRQGFAVLNAQKGELESLENNYSLPRVQSPEQILIDKEWASSLSKDTRRMIEIIVNAPNECLEGVCIMAKHFEKDLKWNREKVWSCIKEIRAFLRSR